VPPVAIECRDAGSPARGRIFDLEIGFDEGDCSPGELEELDRLRAIYRSLRDDIFFNFLKAIRPIQKQHYLEWEEACRKRGRKPRESLDLGSRS
jgi:hypothetical protein